MSNTIFSMCSDDCGENFVCELDVVVVVVVDFDNVVVVVVVVFFWSFEYESCHDDDDLL